MIDFGNIKIFMIIAAGTALFFALLYHYLSLEEADE